ncbi:hypothetical protein H0W26_00955 [Candidatus Dependentiae bacterium]|nr:hypothetical protein [Candidatus Dependentiae bacterium]
MNVPRFYTVLFFLLVALPAVAGEHSSIVSVSTLKNQEKTIYIAGFLERKNHPTEEEAVIQQSIIDDLLAPDRPLIFLPFISVNQNQTNEENTYKGFHDLIAFKLCAQQQLAQENGHCIFLPNDPNADLKFCIDFTSCFFYKPFFIALLEPAKFPYGTTLETLDDALNKATTGYKELFFKESADGFFMRLKKEILLFVAQHTNRALFPTCNDYENLISTYNEIIEKSEIPLHNEWSSAKGKASNYISLYKKDTRNSFLIELVLDAIYHKRSFLAALHEFQLEVLEPLRIIKKFENLSLITQTINKHNNVFFFYYCPLVKNLIQLLDQLNFESTSHGLFIESEPDTIIGYDQSVFYSYKELAAFFSSIQTGIDYSPVSLQNLNNALSMHYFEPSTNSYSGDSSRDHSVKKCLMCPSTVQVCNAYATTPNELYCTSGCFFCHLYTTENASYKLSNLLKETHPLTNKEALILKQCGALCYLRAITYMPCISQKSGAVYQLPLDRIITALKSIENGPAKIPGTAWAETLDLCTKWGISLPSISSFLEIYKKQKEDYLKSLLNQRLHEKDDLEEDILFNKKDFCRMMQNHMFKTVKENLGFTNDTSNNSVLFLYKKLVSTIKQRVDLNTTNILSLLSLADHSANLDDLLSSIGYVDTSLIIKKEKKKRSQTVAKDYLPILYDEESFESEENYSPCSYPSLEQNSVIQEEDAVGFMKKPSVRKKEKPLLLKISSVFAEGLPYTITLFNARKYLPQDSHAFELSLEKWRQYSNNGIRESRRVAVPFAFADTIPNPCIKFNSYGCPIIAADESRTIDEALSEKVDLHHLFTRKIDTFLSSYGIAETIEGLIQLSIPGEIAYGNTVEVGFFQYSFTKKGICIHRCFKLYNQTSISNVLREVLYTFLQETYPEKYTQVKAHLKG